MSPQRIDAGDLLKRPMLGSSTCRTYLVASCSTRRGLLPQEWESLPKTANTDAAAVVDRTLYGALQVLDGVTPPIGNEDLDVEFVLTARVSDRVTVK